MLPMSEFVRIAEAHPEIVPPELLTRIIRAYMRCVVAYSKEIPKEPKQ